jgi:PPOX class probable F420-dependent enzyme
VSTVTGARQLVTRQPLLDQPVVAVLTTVRADGRLQCGPMWFVRDGTDVLFSTMREFAKARRLRANPAATLLAIDPRDSNNWVELRGRVQMEEAEAVGVNDDIAERYTGRRPYFGGVVAAGLAEVEHPVTCRLAPATVHSGRQCPVRPCQWRRARRCQRRAQAAAAGTRRFRPIISTCSTDRSWPPWPPGYRTARRRPNRRGSSATANDLLVNTNLERRDGRNLVEDPRATLLVIDPVGERWIEIRAEVELPINWSEIRVIARLHPRKIQISSQSGAWLAGAHRGSRSSSPRRRVDLEGALGTARPGLPDSPRVIANPLTAAQRYRSAT